MKELCAKILAVIIIFAVLPNFAFSKEKGKEKKQVIDFEALTIDGKLKKPEGMFIMDRQPLKFKRLLNLDESFIANIIKSIDEF